MICFLSWHILYHSAQFASVSAATACHFWVFGSCLGSSGLCVSEPRRSGRQMSWWEENSTGWRAVWRELLAMRRGLSEQSRASGCAAGCREGIYCYGGCVWSWLLAEVERRDRVAGRVDALCGQHMTDVLWQWDSPSFQSPWLPDCVS